MVTFWRTRTLVVPDLFLDLLTNMAQRYAALPKLPILRLLTHWKSKHKIFTPKKWRKQEIIVLPLGFREAFSLLPSCLCGFIWSNTVELEGFGKDTCFFDEMQYPYEDTEQPYFFMADDNGGIQEWFPWYLPPMYNEVANPTNAVWNGSIGCLLF